MQPFEITVPAEAGRPGLLLSAPTMDDAERVHEICQDPEIHRWTPVPSPYSLDDARQYLTGVVAPGWETGRELTWAIRERRGAGGEGADGRPVGMIGLRVDSSGRGDLRFWVAPEARGRGVATRAAGAVVDAALDPGALALPAVSWSCWIDDGVPNWPSWRIAWSLGFTREGLRRAARVRDGRRLDEWTATLLAGEPRRPVAPWDGPAAPAQAPLVAHDGVGEREGDDPEALVRRFHHVYGLPIRDDGPSLDRESLDMRMSLIAEEFAELTGAVYGRAARAEIEAACARARAADDGSRDLVETADALADLVYVIYGMALETGIDLAAVLAEVQRSNMSKLGEDGRPIYREDGKVLKGPGYFPPDVARVLREQRGAAVRADRA
ncbi:GNAT family N-acetyltransferase [Actinomyces timonensis]|uniref:GNAT family N-acetyltransferase n=1 Tax=Actinomyces timonensis TaxID=1288391 RepID=A0AAU8N2A2_9ACTO